MVRVFVFDKDFKDGEMPSEIIDFSKFNGRIFHVETRACYQLYDGLSIRLLFQEDSSGDFRDFAAVTIEYKDGVFSRRIEKVI